MQDLEMLPSWAGRTSDAAAEDTVEEIVEETAEETVEEASDNQISVDEALAGYEIGIPEVPTTSIPEEIEGRRRSRGRSLVFLLVLIIASIAAGVLAGFLFTAVAVL